MRSIRILFLRNGELLMFSNRGYLAFLPSSLTHRIFTRVYSPILRKTLFYFIMRKDFHNMVFIICIVLENLISKNTSNVYQFLMFHRMSTLSQVRLYTKWISPKVRGWNKKHISLHMLTKTVISNIFALNVPCSLLLGPALLCVWLSFMYNPSSKLTVKPRFCSPVMQNGIFNFVCPAKEIFVGISG